MKRFLFLLLGSLFFSLNSYGMYAVFAHDRPGANDFYPRWRAAQLYWQEGVDPYSDEATLAIQMGIRGRAARPGEDQLAFAYPFYTVFVLRPMVGLPYSWSQAIWMTLLQFASIGGVLLYVRLLGWELPVGLLAIIVLWAVIFYHSGRTILLGQFAGLIFFCTAAMLFLLAKGWDVPAGLLLALTTLKPQMSVLLIPAMLLWAVGQRRYRFAAGFGGAMALLVGFSFWLLPTWLGEFWTQIGRYPSYTDLGSPVWIISHIYWPAVGQVGEIGLSLLLLAWLLFEWRNLPQSRLDSPQFHWLVGLTLLVTNLIVLRTATTNYVILYLPLFWWLARSGRSRNLITALFCLVSLFAMWGLFLTTVSGDYESPLMYLPLPLTLLGLMIYEGSVMKGKGLANDV